LFACFESSRIIRRICLPVLLALLSSPSNAASSSHGCQDWQRIVFFVADSVARGESSGDIKQRLGGDAAQVIEAIERKLRTSTKEQVAKEFVSICTAGGAGQNKSAGSTTMAVAKSPIFERCAALSVAAPSATSSAQMSTISAKQNGWLGVFFFAYGEEKGKSLLAAQVSKIKSLSSSDTENLAKECNGRSILDLLQLPPVSRDFPTDPRWHAEACMAILNTAADEAANGEAERVYRVASKKAYFAMSVLAAEGVGEEGGTKVFRWLSQRNGGRVGDVSVADIRYCTQYYI